jgi:hypothetical protein
MVKVAKRIQQQQAFFFRLEGLPPFPLPAERKHTEYHTVGEKRKRRKKVKVPSANPPGLAQAK